MTKSRTTYYMLGSAPIRPRQNATDGHGDNSAKKDKSWNFDWLATLEEWILKHLGRGHGKAPADRVPRETEEDVLAIMEALDFLAREAEAAGMSDVEETIRQALRKAGEFLGTEENKRPWYRTLGF